MNSRLGAAEILSDRVRWVLIWVSISPRFSASGQSLDRFSDTGFRAFFPAEPDLVDAPTVLHMNCKHRRANAAHDCGLITKDHGERPSRNLVATPPRGDSLERSLAG